MEIIVTIEKNASRYTNIFLWIVLQIWKIDDVNQKSAKIRSI